MTNPTDKELRGKIPAHIVSYYGSGRAFKAEKRAQLKRAIKALADLKLGCAFFPGKGYELASALNEQAKALRDELSVKNWGR